MSNKIIAEEEKCPKCSHDKHGEKNMIPVNIQVNHFT